MADGSWLARQTARRRCPADANDPTNFPIVPYHREDLIPRWRLINDRPSSQWLELPPRNQSNASSIFRAGSLIVEASFSNEEGRTIDQFIRIGEWRAYRFYDTRFIAQ